MIRAEDKAEAVDEEETRSWQPLQDNGMRLLGSGFRPMNFRYPIFLDLSGKKCLVAGEGHEIAAKVEGLVEASAQVTYVNPRAEVAIEALAMAGLVQWERRAFEPRDLAGCFLVISDLPDNSLIFQMAEEQGILCNSVDDPAHCRFSFGSLHRQGDLTIAISTNGYAPALAVRLKERMQRDVGPEYAEFMRMLKEARPQITTQIADFGARRALWYRIVDSDILALLRAGDTVGAHALLRNLIDATLGAER
jgi:precorrin-2 dehydrogenase/sirohydrochlorin ferrochelatase